MLVDNNYCFACGKENPDGLQLEFKYSEDGSKVETTYIPPEKFQGWKGIVHGGIITTLLDEIMARETRLRAGLEILPEKEPESMTIEELRTRFLKAELSGNNKVWDPVCW